MAHKAFLSMSARSGGRFLVTAAAVVFLALPKTLAAEQIAAGVTVSEEHGVYTVMARFIVDESPSAAWAVLTDYEHIPRFMPGVRTSVIRERGAGWALVEQEVESHLLLFSKRIHLVLRIEEQLDALIFHDRCGGSFARYDGAWRLSSEEGHTVITYELTAEPSFDVPSVILKRLLRRDSGRMIASLKQEIAAIAASGSAALHTEGLPRQHQTSHLMLISTVSHQICDMMLHAENDSAARRRRTEGGEGARGAASFEPWPGDQ
jgi:ribosome-associated toxin RatA of RatAB toxin-antitoxin module